MDSLADHKEVQIFNGGGGGRGGSQGLVPAKGQTSTDTRLRSMDTNYNQNVLEVNQLNQMHDI